MNNISDRHQQLRKYNFLSGVNNKAPFVPLLPPDDEEVNEENLNLFFQVMFERQEIWYKRFMGEKTRPWTKDPILDKYKFTNVYRELDRSSQYVIQEIIVQWHINEDFKNLLWKIMLYRFFNKPDAFQDSDLNYRLRLPKYDEYDVETFYQSVIKYREKDNPFHNAYIMNVVAIDPNFFEPEKGLFKDHAYCHITFPMLHELIGIIGSPQFFKENILIPQHFIDLIKCVKGVGDFMAHELWLDVCYIKKYLMQYEEYINFDENSFTNVGPGASLGLKLLFPSLKPEEQIKGIYTLRDISKDGLAQFGNFKYIQWNGIEVGYQMTIPNITLHQIEFWLCEFSKYWKIKNGFTMKRSKFEQVSPKDLYTAPLVPF